jgi:hypothetical protein
MESLIEIFVALHQNKYGNKFCWYFCIQRAPQIGAAVRLCHVSSADVDVGGPGYRRMLDLSAAGRAGAPDEVGTVGALLMGADGAFIAGSDFLMDGGVTAAYWFGELAPTSQASNGSIPTHGRATVTSPHATQKDGEKYRYDRN